MIMNSDSSVLTNCKKKRGGVKSSFLLHALCFLVTVRKHTLFVVFTEFGEKKKGRKFVRISRRFSRIFFSLSVPID